MGPRWTSRGALEIDLFARSEADFESCRAALALLGDVEFARSLGEGFRYRSAEEAVADAMALFNAERYWESHEALEGVWRGLKGDDKLYLQGVILTCAAFVHHQKGEDEVALGVLRRAERQLLVRRTDYLGIGNLTLLQGVQGILASRTFKPFKL